MTTTPPDTGSINEWRDPEERARLVERVITLERENNLLSRTLRELTQAATDGEPIAEYITALQARITVLEQNIDKLIREREKRKAA